MRVSDADIKKRFPEVTVHVTNGCRHIPLRPALEQFSEIGATELIMNENGVYVRVFGQWRHWSKETLDGIRTKLRVDPNTIPSYMVTHLLKKRRMGLIADGHEIPYTELVAPMVG